MAVARRDAGEVVRLWLRSLGPAAVVVVAAVAAMAVALVPIYIWAGTAATALGFSSQEQATPGDLTALLAAVLVPLCLALAAITAALTAGIAIVSARTAEGRPPRPVEALRAGLRRAPRLVAVLALGLGSVAAAFVATPFLVVLGLLGLAVTPLVRRLQRRRPGLRWPATRTLVIVAVPFGAAAALAVRWALVVPATALEGCSVRAAFARSRELGRPDLGRVAAVLALFGLVPVVLIAWLNATFVAPSPDQVGAQVATTVAGLVLLTLALAALDHLFLELGGSTDGLDAAAAPLDGHRAVAGLALLALIAAVLPALTAVPSASALPAGTTIVVDSLGDAPDAVPGDGACDDGTGACTLRAAVDEANLSSDEVIGFSVSGTITVGSVLFLTQPVVVDGDGVQVVVSGGGTSKVFATGMEIPGGGYGAIRNLTIADGFDGSTGGAALYNDGTSRGFSLENVTVRDTVAAPGALFGGAVVNGSNLTISNSTFVGNIADVTTDGSDVGNIFAGQVQIVHSTFTGSSGSSSLATSGIAMDVRNSVISAPAFACSGIITGSGNVASDATGVCPGATATVPTMGLTPLADNGGITPTVRLLPSSPAVDAGDPAHCLATDQRGVARPLGATCDAGAYELDPATATTLTATPNPSSFGGGVTLDATVTATVEPVTPTGSVELFDGATSLGTVPLDGTGAASTTVTTLTAGPHSLTAVYVPDTALATSTSPAASLTVDPAASSVVLSSTGSPTLGGDPVTFTVDVAGASGSVPTGSVTLSDGASPLATLPLDGTGRATYLTSSLSGGPHSLVAAYPGDANHDPASSAPLAHDVVASTTTALTPPPAATTYGNDAVFDVVVSPSGGGSTPTGLVTLTSGGLPVGSATLDGSGAATITVTSLPPGTASVIASYAGDSYNAASDSAAVTHDVATATTATSLTLVPATSNVFGTGLTFDIAVTSPDSTATPTGIVTVYDGASVVTIVGLDPDGTSSSTLSTLAAGTYALRAEYAGATGFAASTSGTTAHDVLPATTSTALVAGAPSSVSGESVALTATVTSPDSPRTPVGTVTFRDGATDLATVALDGAGVALLDTATIATGARSLTAVYNGGPDFGGSTSAGLAHLVSPADVVVTVVSSPDPSSFGSLVAITVDVSAAAPGTGTPTGTVTIRDGATVLGTPALDGSGRASISAAALAVGGHTLHADYSGDTDFNPGTGSTTQTVDPDATTVTVASSAPSQPYGRPVTFTATVWGTGAFTPTGLVTFTAGGRVLGSVALDGAGQARLTVADLALGTYPVVADYAGDGDFTAGTGQVLQQMTTAPTAVGLVVTPTSPTVADVVTLTATVSAPGASVSPTGTVSFFDNGSLIGSAVVDGSGQARLSRQLTRAFHDLEARFSGTPGWGSSTSAVVQIVPGRTTSTLDISASPASIQVGQSVTLRFAPTVPPGVPLPTGVINASDPYGLLAPIPLVNGVAAVTVTAPLTPGPWTVTAWYPGDLNYEPVPPTTFDVQIDPAPTSVAVVADPGAGYALETPTTLRAYVSSAYAGGAIAGTVRFSSGAPGFGTRVAVVDGAGVAQVAVGAFPAGTWPVTAEFLPATSSPYATSVGSTTYAAQKRPVVVRLGAAGFPKVGRPTRVTVTVDDVGAPVAPTGTVVIDGGNGVTCTTTVAAGGCDLVFPSTGPVTITATYAGDGRFEGGSGSITSTVTTSTPTLTVLNRTPQWVTGDPITISWSLVGPTTGTVTVRSPFGVACTVPAASGSCTTTFPFAQRGSTFDLDVAYSGNADWDPAYGSVRGTLLGCYPVRFEAIPATGGTVTGSAGNCNGGTGFVEGTRVVATATPAADHVLSQWLESGSDYAYFGFAVGEDARSATAVFNLDCVSVSYRSGQWDFVSPTGYASGYVELPTPPTCPGNPAYDPVTGTTTVRYLRGTAVQATAVVRFADATQFKGWYVQDDPYGFTYVPDATLDLVLTGDVDLTASFGARCYQPPVIADGNGTARILTAPNCIDRWFGSGYLYGTDVEIGGTADPYHYIGEMRNGAGAYVAAAAYAVGSDSPIIVSIRECSRLTLRTTGSGRGTVEPSVDSTCDGGEPGWYRPGEIDLRPVAQPGYKGSFGFPVEGDEFKRWYDDAGIAPNRLRSYPLPLDMSVDRTVTAVFTSPSLCAGIALVADQPSWVGGLEVSQPPEMECRSRYEYLQGRPFTLTAGARQGSPLIQWEVTGQRDHDLAAISGRVGPTRVVTRYGSHVPGGTTTIRNVYGPVVATAYACAAIASEMELVNHDGSITDGPAPDGFISYDTFPTCPGTGNGWLVGETVGYAAGAQPTGYEFLGWGGDVGGTDPEGSITLDGSRPSTVIRSAYQIRCYTLTVTPADRTVRGEEPNCPNTDPADDLYVGGTIVALHTWDGGEVWVGWRGDVETSKNPSWVYVDEDSTARAEWRDKTWDEDVVDFFEDVGDAVAVAGKKLVGVAILAASALLESTFTAVLGVVSLVSMGVGAIAGGLGAPTDSGFMDVMKGIQQTTALFSSPFSCGAEWAFSDGGSTSTLSGTGGDLKDAYRDPAKLNDKVRSYRESIEAIDENATGWAATKKKFAVRAKVVKSGVGTALTAVGVGTAIATADFGWDASAADAWGTESGRVFMSCMEQAIPDYWGMPPLGYS